MKGQNKKNNKGFSLTELIVVIAIMGIVAVGGMVTLGLLYSASGKEASAKLNSVLAKTRTEAMSKASASVRIYEDSIDSKYYAVYKIGNVEQEPVMLGDARVEISYKELNGSSKEITGANELVISFDRDTGAFKPIRTDQAANKEFYCESITIVSGHKTYIIKCERLTGKTIVN